MPRDWIGVYAFWYRPTGKCIYVGKAVDQTIRERLRQHWNGYGSQGLLQWMEAYGEHLSICYLETAERRIKTLERRLIRRWHPEANVRLKKA